MAQSQYSLNPPPVYKWFVIYCILMALLYAATALMGIVLLFVEPDQDMSEAEAKLMALLFLVLGVVFAVPFASAPFLPRKNWVWILGLVLICLGLTSACCLPVCVPLLIFWVKPEMKEFYGRTVVPMPPPPPQWN